MTPMNNAGYPGCRNQRQMTGYEKNNAPASFYNHGKRSTCPRVGEGSRNSPSEKSQAGIFKNPGAASPTRPPSNGTDAPQRTDFADGDKRVGSLLIHR